MHASLLEMMSKHIFYSKENSVAKYPMIMITHIAMMKTIVTISLIDVGKLVHSSLLSFEFFPTSHFT